MDVPKSAPPPQPGVLYVLPTFGWDCKENVPVNNTGVKASLPTSDLLKHMISWWGIDPIWASSPLPGDLPTLANFKNPAKTASGLTLQEVKGLKVPTRAWYDVGVAGYEPQLGPDRQL